jgi:PST family polysaccharide transporter
LSRPVLYLPHTRRQYLNGRFFKVIAALSRMMRSQLAHNALSLYAVQGLNYLMPLIVLPYLLRVLSPEGYGSIVFAQALLGYAAIFTDFGFNLTAARDISVARNDPRRIAEGYWTTMAAKASLLLLCLIVIGGVVVADAKFRSHWQVFAACGFLVIGSSAFPAWYFQGLEKLKEAALIQAVAKCVITGCTFLLVKSPGDIVLAAFLMSSPQFIGVLVALCLRIPLSPPNFYRPTVANVRDALKGSSDMFLSTASSSLYLYSNTFILGLMSGDRAVALYGLGNRLVLAVQSLTVPVTQAVFPRASILFASHPDQALQLVKRVAWLLFPAIALVSLLMFIFAPFIVSVLGSAKYADAASVMRIMAPIPLLVTVSNVLVQIVMVNLGLTKQLLRMYITVGALNLLLLPPLVHFYQANGAALSLTIAETLAPIIILRVLWRRHAFRKR